MEHIALFSPDLHDMPLPLRTRPRTRWGTVSPPSEDDCLSRLMLMQQQYGQGALHAQGISPGNGAEFALNKCIRFPANVIIQ